MGEAILANRLGALPGERNAFLVDVHGVARRRAPGLEGLDLLARGDRTRAVAISWLVKGRIDESLVTAAKRIPLYIRSPQLLAKDAWNALQ